MEMREIVKVMPKCGNEFIYRYYDEQGKSYIGHTKQSISRRAGKNGANYLRGGYSKFQEAIACKGFDQFKVEILEEVPQDIVEEKEKYYIAKYNSRNAGYNSTYGGRNYYENIRQNNCPKYNFCVEIDLGNYNHTELENIRENLTIYFGLDVLSVNQSIDNLLKKIDGIIMPPVLYEYYLDMEETYGIYCHPIAIFFNYVDVMAQSKWKTREAIDFEMARNENLGGDILSSGDYNALEIKLINEEKLIFPITT